MRANKEIEQEIKFHNELTDVAGTKFKVTSIESINNNEIVKINPGYDSYYYNAKHKKTKIIIHNTVGVLRSDIAALTKKDWHVSVPYVISRDGTIYELFNPEMWSYHLGRGAIGGNKVNSKSSIGIELSSYGPLNLVGGNLETMYSEVTYTDAKGKSRKTSKDIYCGVNETQYFTEIDTPFRGYTYFAGYTENQMKSLKDLIDYLCERFDIPKKILDENVRNEVFKSSAESVEYTGICSHVNFISSGKWDVGPEMDWDYLFSEEIVIEDPIVIEPEEPEEPEEPSSIKEPIKKFSFVVFLMNLLKMILKR